MQPRVSILITTWNTQTLTLSLLHSLVDHALSCSHEIILVDNASSDKTVDAVKKEFPGVNLVLNTSNLGYARGNNQAYRISSGEFLLLLGSDTQLIDGSLDRMIAYLEANETVGAVSCRLLNPDRTPQLSCRRFPTLWDGVMTYLSFDNFAPRYTMPDFDYYKTQDVEQPAATCLLVRSSVVETIGLFDERYTILFNDVDLCKRLMNRGSRIVYFGDAEIIHHGSQSTTKAPASIRLEMYRNILLYYSENVGTLAYWVLLPILTMRLLIVTRSFTAFQLLLYKPERRYDR